MRGGEKSNFVLLVIASAARGDGGARMLETQTLALDELGSSAELTTGRMPVRLARSGYFGPTGPKWVPL